MSCCARCGSGREWPTARYPSSSPPADAGRAGRLNRADRLDDHVVAAERQAEGCRRAAPGFLPRVAEFCGSHGIVFVADEVQAGLARTGDWFASEHEGIIPDLVCSAKALGGGLPISAVTGRAEIMDAAPAGGLGGTYAGNPVACAAALGALETIENGGLVERARAIGEHTLPRLNALKDEHPVVGDVRGRGAMLALEFCRPGSTEPAPAVAARVAKHCHEHGVLVLVCGTYGNVIRLLPPLVIEFGLLDDAVGVLADAIKAAAR